MKLPMTSLKKKRNALVSRLLYPSYNQLIFNGRDCVAVFPELKVVYNRVKKSGSTSIVGLLTDLQDYRFESARAAKKSLSSPPVMSIAELRQVGSYYSFAFVRDPYARVLSAFLDKLASGNPKFKDIPGSGRNSPEAFGAFLRFLEEGGLHHDRHWWPQVDLLYKDASAFSFIGKLETMAEDMERVLRDIGRSADEIADFRSPHRISTHTTDAAQKIAAYYDNERRRIVGKLYARDFNVLGYPA